MIRSLTRLKSLKFKSERPLSAHNFMRVLASRELPEAAFGHVGGLRSAIELGFSKEIFNRVKKDDIAYLREVCSRMHDGATSREQFMVCETEFHSRLIEMTENALAISLWQMMEPFLRRISPIRVPIPRSVIEKHDRIVDALDASDEAAFRKEMHIRHDHKLAWDSERYDKHFLDPQYLSKSKG